MSLTMKGFTKSTPQIYRDCLRLIKHIAGIKVYLLLLHTMVITIIINIIVLLLSLFPSLSSLYNNFINIISIPYHHHEIKQSTSTSTSIVIITFIQCKQEHQQKESN